MSQNTARRSLQRIILILSTGAFLGSTVFGLVGLFTTDTSTARREANTAAQDKEKSINLQLKSQEQGYETVLKREPNNQVALEGLVKVRLETNNLQGAVEPLEKLVKLNPKQAVYKELLVQIKQQVSKPLPTKK